MRAFLGVFFAILTISLSAATVSAQCVSLTSLNTAVTENFDTLANSAGSTTNNLTITGWAMTESGGGARDNEQYAVDTGGANTGDTYSYGAAAATDRALGSLRSGTLAAVYGACFTNNTGSTINNLSVAYTGEEWRLGATGRADKLDFDFSTDATSLVTGNYTAFDALDFSTPNQTTTGAKDGNAAANRTALSSTISSISVPNGGTFWIRWTDVDAVSSDDGLAIDDFSLTPSFVAPPPTLSIDDVTAAEGNSGSTNFVFTVSLSSPAPAGGVTFDIATADGTATAADSDYASQSSNGVTIGEGQQTSTFTVAVAGDTVVEPNETFFVNVTNVTGATTLDSQGQGTIQNDDVALPEINFQFAGYVEDESQTMYVFARRTGDLSGTSTVDFTTQIANLNGYPAATGGASCVSGVDFVNQSVTFTFLPNDEFASAEIPLCADSLIEPTELFPMMILNATNATVGSTGTVFASIIDVASDFQSVEPILIGSSGDTFSGSINVATPQATILNLRVTLFDVTFSNSENLDVLLVGPQGQKMLLMADAGGPNGMPDRTTLTFYDNAGQVLPDNSLIASGSYEPTTWEAGQSSFLAPAPAGPYAEPGSSVGGAVTLASVFSGTNPNGTWTLYVRDDQNAFQPLGLSGEIGGWGIQFLAPTAAGVSVSGTVRSGKVGIRDAIVTVSGGNLAQPIIARTNTFGNYSIEGLTAGQTYVISVNSRRYTFSQPTQVLNVNDNVTEVDFRADIR